jgi:cytochrome b561
MTLLGTAFRYGPIAQAFHWAMAVLVIAALISAGGGIVPLHEAIGVTIVVMVVLRLAWRAFFDRLPGKPPMRTALARWSWRIDILLYLLLFAVPITGIIGAHEVQDALFQGLSVAETHAPGPSVLDLHRLFGLLLTLAAGLHSAFALFHHYVKRDSVLKMMLPGGPARAV